MVKALQDFSKLNQKKILKMDLIEWWLLKYSKHYKETYNFLYNQDLFELEDGSTIRLPSFGKKTNDEEFLDLYEALDKISEFHRSEEYLKQELVYYHKIKDSQSDLKNWVTKNEYLGAEKYACFIIDYLDYNKNDKEIHLNIFVPSLEELSILIDRENFRSTIYFLEIFNELYWVQEISP